MNGLKMEKRAEENTNPREDDCEEDGSQLAPDFSKRLIIDEACVEKEMLEKNTSSTYLQEGSHSGTENPGSVLEKNVPLVPFSEIKQTEAQKDIKQTEEQIDVIVVEEVDSVESTSTAFVSIATTNSGRPADVGSHLFVCRCGEKFDRSVELAAHRRWSCRLKERKAQCEDCKTWFASEQGLRRHMRRVHGGASKCEACGGRFRNNIQLTRHWLDVHHEDGDGQGGGPFKCYVCGSDTFKNKYELECHWLQHKYDKRQQRRQQEEDSMTFSSLSPTTHVEPPKTSSSEMIEQQQRADSATNSQTSHQSSFQAQSHWHMPAPPPFPPPLPPHVHFHPPLPFPPPPPPPHMFMPPPPPFMHPFFPPPPPFSQPQQHNDAAATNTTSQSHPPRHDHTYVEPTTAPFFHSAGFRHHQHHHGRPFCQHGGKMKWKKYIKLMMKGLVPNLLPDTTHPYWESWAKNSNWKHSNYTTSHKNSDNNDDGGGGFQIVCKFCNKVINREWISWHQRKECPALMTHKCGVCDRVFSKCHLLLKHMHEQNHWRVSTARSSGNHEQVDADTLSNLQKKMNDALNFTKCDQTSKSDTHERSNINENVIEIISDTVSKPNLTVEKDTQMVTDNDRNSEKKKEGFKCCVCSSVFVAESLLKFHLQDHIDRVTTIQKVRDWTIQSAEYFHIANSEDGVDSDLESEITSTTGSAATAASSVLSVVSESTSVSHDKWTKPHKKGSRHHHAHKNWRCKGEISVCDFCGDQFPTLKDLEAHIKKRHPDSKLRCPVCQKSFSWKKRGKFYERHLESHYGVKIFKHKCEYCDKTFLEKAKLQAHVAALHTHELPFKCGTCGKSYANKSSLVRHERKHTGAHPYSCPQCSMTFLEKRELIRHSATHTGVAPFSCDICGQGFTLKTSLTTHKKNKHPDQS